MSPDSWRPITNRLLVFKLETLSNPDGMARSMLTGIVWTLWQKIIWCITACRELSLLPGRLATMPLVNVIKVKQTLYRKITREIDKINKRRIGWQKKTMPHTVQRVKSTESWCLLIWRVSCEKDDFDRIFSRLFGRPQTITRFRKMIGWQCQFRLHCRCKQNRMITNCSMLRRHLPGRSDVDEEKRWIFEWTRWQVRLNFSHWSQMMI